MTHKTTNPQGMTKSVSNFLKNRGDLIFITSIFTILYWLLKSLHSVPHLDDWAYIQTVEQVYHTGKWKISNWSSTSLLFQIVWGLTFTKLFGLSILSLRMSTLCLNFLGVCALSSLLKGLKVSIFYRCLAILLLLFNPIYFDLSNSFMSDVQYTSLSLLTIYFYFKGMKEDRSLHLVLGSVFASCSFLTRQLGIFIFLSVAFYLYLNRKKFTVAHVIFALLLPAGTLFSYAYWYANGGATWHQKQLAISNSLSQFATPLAFLPELILRAFQFSTTLGLFLFPLLAIHAVFGQPQKREFMIYLAWIMITLLAISLQIMMGKSSVLPILDGLLAHGNSGSLSGGFWIAITLLGYLGNVLFGSFLTKQYLMARRRFDFSSQTTIIGLYLAAVFAFSLFHFHVFDRYLTPLLPYLMLWIAPSITDFSPGVRLGSISSMKTFKALSYAALMLLFFLIGLIIVQNCSWFESKVTRALEPLDVHEDGGFAYITSTSDLPNPNDEGLIRSKMLLFEGNFQLGPISHIHKEIRMLGSGRYSHWKQDLWFSTSDNTDPRTNGRSYRIEYTHPPYTLWVLMGLICSASLLFLFQSIMCLFSFSRMGIVIFMLPYLGFLSIYSISNTSSFMQRGDLRWHAAQSLIENGVQPKELYVDLSWNGYHLYEETLNYLMENTSEPIGQMTPFQLMKSRAQFSFEKEDRFTLLSQEKFPTSWSYRLLHFLFGKRNLDYEFLTVDLYQRD